MGKVALGLLLALATGAAQAAELIVFAAGAVQHVLLQAAPSFEQAHGHKLTLHFGTVGAMRDRVLAGERADVVVLSEAAIGVLMGRGLAAGARRDVGRIGVGIAVPKGTAPPDIATPEALRTALLATPSLAFADPAKGATAGTHFAKVLERLGIVEAVRAKTTLLPFGVEVIEAVAQGRFQMGVSQTSEIAANPGVTLVGPLPPALQLSTTYTAAVLAQSPSPAAAAALVAFLGGENGAPLFRAGGFQR